MALEIRRLTKISRFYLKFSNDINTRKEVENHSPRFGDPTLIESAPPVACNRIDAVPIVIDYGFHVLKNYDTNQQDQTNSKS